EGGIIFPLAVQLPGEWSMGLMTEFDYLRNAEGNGYHSEFVNSVTFGRPIAGDLCGYVEFCSVVSTEKGEDWLGTANLGLTYSVTDDVQLDCGVNIGLTHAADD